MKHAIIHDSRGEHHKEIPEPKDFQMFGLPATWQGNNQKLNEGMEPS